MTVTRRGSGYALNGDVNELTEALSWLEGYIEQDAAWAHNRKQRPAMMAKAAGYRKLREFLAELHSVVTQSRQFTVGETTYETRVAQSDDGFYIRIYQEDKQVSPTYSVTGEVGNDLADDKGLDAVSELMDMAERDLAERLKKRN